MSKQETTSSSSTPPRDIACVNRYQQTVDAILSRPESVIRAALQQLYLRDTRDSEALQSRIYELVTGVSASVEESNEENPLPSPTKRMREETQTPEEARNKAKKPRAWETSIREPVECIRCREQFNLFDKAKGCFCHKGTMKLNRHSLAWEKEALMDPDKYSSKELDIEINRKLYANGFKWTCCGQPGGARGCEWHKHKAYESDDTDETWSSESRESGKSGDGDEGGEGDENA